MMSRLATSKLPFLLLIAPELVKHIRDFETLTVACQWLVASCKTSFVYLHFKV